MSGMPGVKKTEKNTPNLAGWQEGLSAKNLLSLSSQAFTNLVDERLGLGQIIHARVLLRGDSASIVFALGLDSRDLEAKQLTFQERDPKMQRSHTVNRPKMTIRGWIDDPYRWQTVSCRPDSDENLRRLHWPTIFALCATRAYSFLHWSYCGIYFETTTTTTHRQKRRAFHESNISPGPYQQAGEKHTVDTLRTTAPASTRSGEHARKCCSSVSSRLVSLLAGLRGGHLQAGKHLHRLGRGNLELLLFLG